MADVTGMLQAAAGPEPATAQAGALLVTHALWPYLAAYSWGPNGFRNNYPNKGFFNYGVTPFIGEVNNSTLSPNENYFAMVGRTSPYVRVFPWTSNGVGNPYSNPSVLPVFTSTATGSGARAARFNNAENVLAVCGEHTATASNRQYIYGWSSSGFGTRFSDPPTAISPSRIESVAFSNNDDAIFFGVNGNPYLYAYAWNNTTGYGAKYSDPPGVTGIGNVFGIVLSSTGDEVIIAHSSTPYVSAWPWSSSTGWGSKYSNPATLPSGACLNISINQEGNRIALASTVTPYCLVYQWSASGFGSLFSSTGKALAPRPAYSVAFSLDDSYIAIGYDGNTLVAGTSSPYVKVWEWDNTSGFGDVMPDPFGLFLGFNSPSNGGRLGGYGYSVIWSSVGDPLLYRDYMVIAQQRSPYLQAYDWRDHDNNGRGGNMNYNSPPSMEIGTPNSVLITNDGSHVICTRASTVAIYPFTPNTPTTGTGGGFGTRLTSGAPSFSGGNKLALNPANTAFAVSLTSTPYIRAYPWSSPFTTVGTQYASPATAVPAFARQVSWSNNGAYIAVAHNTTPYLTVYEWDDTTGFGAKVANPSPIVGTTGYGVCFTGNDEAIIFGHAGSPYISAWAWNPGFGTKYANPSTAVGGNFLDPITMSPKKDIVIGTTAVNGYYTVGYQWSNTTGFGSRLSAISPSPGSTQSRGRAFNFVEPYKCLITFPGAPYYRLYPFDSGGWGSGTTAFIPTQPSSSTSTANLGSDVAFGRVPNYFV